MCLVPVPLPRACCPPSPGTSCLPSSLGTPAQGCVLIWAPQYPGPARQGMHPAGPVSPSPPPSSTRQVCGDSVAFNFQHRQLLDTAWRPLSSLPGVKGGLEPGALGSLAGRVGEQLCPVLLGTPGFPGVHCSPLFLPMLDQGPWNLPPTPLLIQGGDSPEGTWPVPTWDWGPWHLLHLYYQ